MAGREKQVAALYLPHRASRDRLCQAPASQGFVPILLSPWTVIPVITSRGSWLPEPPQTKCMWKSCTWKHKPNMMRWSQTRRCVHEKIKEAVTSFYPLHTKNNTFRLHTYRPTLSSCFCCLPLNVSFLLYSVGNSLLKKIFKAPRQWKLANFLVDLSNYYPSFCVWWW